MARPICSIEGCETTINARGMCYKHYQRAMKYDDPMGGAQNHGPPEERFYRRVNKTEGCWIWTGKVENSGYGRFQIGGKGSPHVSVHRFAYTLAHGTIPEGMVVMHSCDTPLCVNPAHLSVGTHAQNTADMFAKGRHVSQKPRPKPEDL